MGSGQVGGSGRWTALAHTVSGCCAFSAPRARTPWKHPNPPRPGDGVAASPMPWTRSTPPAPCWPLTTSPRPASTVTGKPLRVLHVCRRHYSDTRTATVNLFKSLVLTADEELRGQFRGRSTVRQLEHADTLVDDAAGSTLERLRRTQLRVLAEQIHILDRTLKANLAEIRALVQTMCPALLEQPGIGPRHRRDRADRLVPPRPIPQ